MIGRIRWTAFLCIFALLAAMSVMAVENKQRTNDPPGIVCVQGFATYYTVESCKSEGTSGVYTANGERYDEDAFTCAMRDRHWGRKFKVTNEENGKTICVRLNDYGPGKRPTAKGVVIDLTPGGWKALGVAYGRGKIRVKVEPLFTTPSADHIADNTPPGKTPTPNTPLQVDPF